MFGTLSSSMVLVYDAMSTIQNGSTVFGGNYERIPHLFVSSFLVLMDKERTRAQIALKKVSFAAICRNSRYIFSMSS